MNLIRKENKKFYSKLLKLSFPISFQSLMLSAVAACDSFMLGRFSQNAMSAVSLATQIQFVQNIFIWAVSGAVVILGAQYWGKKDKKTIEEIFCISLRVNLIISILFFVLCRLIPGKLMWLFTSEQEFIDIGIGYLKIASWSYLITGISQAYLTIMKITDHAGVCSSISTISVIVNIILNYIFIFGAFGIEPMGAEGAATATLISRIIEIILCIVISSVKEFISPSFKGLFIRNKQLTKDFIKNLIPLTGASMLWGLGFTSYTSAMGHMGVDATAANAITEVIRDLMCCFCNGISSAAGIIVGNELGQGNTETGKTYGKKISYISIINGFIVCVAIIALIPATLKFVILSETAIKIYKHLMVIMAVYMIGRCINGILINGIFSSGGDTLFDVYSLAVCMWGIAIPLTFAGVFAFHWSAELVFFFTCFDEVVKIPWVIFHFRKYKWVKDLTRENITKENIDE